MLIDYLSVSRLSSDSFIPRLNPLHFSVMLPAERRRYLCLSRLLLLNLFTRSRRYQSEGCGPEEEE